MVTNLGVFVVFFGAFLLPNSRKPAMPLQARYRVMFYSLLCENQAVIKLGNREEYLQYN